MNLLTQLAEGIRSFSGIIPLRSNIVQSRRGYTPISPNVMGLSGSRSGGLMSTSLSDYSISSFYSKIAEIEDYKCSELTNTILTIYTDYLTNYFNEKSEIIGLSTEVKGGKELEGKINFIFKKLDIIKELKQHLGDIIYYGSYSYKLHWNKQSRMYELMDLEFPYNTIDVMCKGKLRGHLVQSRTGKISELSRFSILRLGNANTDLINDLSFLEYLTDEDKEFDEDQLIRYYRYTAALPLYFTICNKVKEYLLKEQVVSLLSMKDLVQPLLLLFSVDKGTHIDTANQLALNAENLINMYSDISAMLTSNFTIDTIIDNLMNNIRVLPDYNSGLGGMNTVDLSKVTDKIQSIRGDQDNSRENILSTLGIPLDLFAGRSTRWEALKTSERLSSKLNSLMKSLEISIKVIVQNFYYLLTKEDISQDDISVNLFNKTEIEFNKSTINSEIVTTLFNSVTALMGSMQDFMMNSKLIDFDKFYIYIQDQLTSIDPSVADILDEKSFKMLMKSLLAERANEYGIEDNTSYESDSGGIKRGYMDEGGFAEDEPGFYEEESNEESKEEMMTLDDLELPDRNQSPIDRGELSSINEYGVR